MKERDPNQQQRSGRSEVMMRFWHTEGTVTEQARKAEIVRRLTLSNRERAIIAKRVLPLALRGATTEEIHKIQGIEPSQINNTLTKARASGLLPRPTKEETRRAKKLAHLGKRMNKEREYVQEEEKLPTRDEKNSLAFARIVLESGLISEDLQDWRGLNFIYAANKRDLPESFAKRLRLEVFLKALLNADNGNRELMDKYVEWRLKIDKDWFNELAAEEEFITRVAGETGDRLFLDEFLRARKEYAKTTDPRVLDKLASFLKQDPTITKRLAPQMAKIIKDTPSEIIKNNHHGIPITNGEMSMDDIMGWGAR